VVVAQEIPGFIHAYKHDCSALRAEGGGQGAPGKLESGGRWSQ